LLRLSAMISQYFTRGITRKDAGIIYSVAGLVSSAWHPECTKSRLQGGSGSKVEGL